MHRRRFLKNLAALSGAVVASGIGNASLASAGAGAGDYRKLLVLIELKGGNDGLNTVVPYADPAYYALRPKLGIARDAVLQITERAGLHPALAPMLPLWLDGEMAVLQGLGYDRPNLSHFRSIEIWDTASDSDAYLQRGWLTRTFAAAATPRELAADGVVIGSNDLGPLSGSGARAITLTNTERFLRQARLAEARGPARSRALEHILKVEGDIVQAAAHLDARREFATSFPPGPFGNAMHTAAQVIASPAGVVVVRVTLSGFDTHSGQAFTHERLLRQLAEGIAALRTAMIELGRWDDTLVLTYAEFGRRPRENLSQGTDHGTASAHFAFGGRVQGGMYGEAPPLDRLDGNGNLPHAIEFRSLYATVLETWWGLPSRAILGGRFRPLPLLRA